MKKSIIILGLAVMGLASCQQFKKGEGDMEYKIVTDKGGETIKDGDFVAFNAIEKTEEDSVLYSSYDYDRPSLLVKEKSVFAGDLFAALGMLSEGDSAIFKINIDSMVTKLGRPKPEHTKGKYLVYTLKIEKVIPKGQLTDSVFRSKIDGYLKEEMDKAKNSELVKFNAYLKKEDLKPTVTTSGLNYVVSTEGSGAKAVAGDTVVLNYTGKFLTGKVFDTSVESVAKAAGTFNAMRPYEPLRMQAGMNTSIPGFEEALLLFPKGTKATIILPSKLAYGEQGNQGIPPFTPLVFDIEIVNIIPGKVQLPPPTVVPAK